MLGNSIGRLFWRPQAVFPEWSGSEAAQMDWLKFPDASHLIQDQCPRWLVSLWLQSNPITVRLVVVLVVVVLVPFVSFPDGVME